MLTTALQDVAADTRLATAQVGTLRLRLLKVAARVVESYRGGCMAVAAVVREPLITTWPCITEAMHLLRIPPAQEILRRQIEQGILTLHSATQ